MKILSFDVSVSGCAVAVIDFSRTDYHSHHFSNYVETDRGQAEMLIPMIDELVQKANWTMTDIDVIAVTRGPGSFTGVRIGLATARSLAMALSIPAFGFSTLDVMAEIYNNPLDTLFLIDTKRGDFYGQIGHGAEASIWSNDKIKLYEGQIVAEYKPDAYRLASMAYQALQTGKMASDFPLTPIYLRDAEVSKPKRLPIQVINSSSS
jgi:tRNA threonylcarbamoyl adenosine modification protein YeaZ